MKFITHSNTKKRDDSRCPIKIYFLDLFIFYRIHWNKFWKEVLYLNKFFREGMKLLLSGKQSERLVSVVCNFFAMQMFL
jgi:hypothetical protein